MRNVSRRAFLKTAGVAALAVAAAGVLSSCSDVPANAPGSTRLIPVNFYEGDKSHVVGTTNMEVNVLATKVDTTTLKIPSVLQEGALKDYVVVGNKETPIENGILWVEVKKEAVEDDIHKKIGTVYFIGADAIDPDEGITDIDKEVQAGRIFVENNKIYKVEEETEYGFYYIALDDIKLPDAASRKGYTLAVYEDYPEDMQYSLVKKVNGKTYVAAFPYADGYGMEVLMKKAN